MYALDQYTLNKKTTLLMLIILHLRILLKIVSVYK